MNIDNFREQGILEQIRIGSKKSHDMVNYQVHNFSLAGGQGGTSFRGAFNVRDAKGIVLIQASIN